MSAPPKRYLHNNIGQKDLSSLSMMGILIFASVIIPLIVFMKPINLEGISYETWIGTETHIDFFYYYKSKLLICCLVALCTFWVYKLIVKREFSYNNMYIPIFIYVIMVIGSTLFAINKDVALFGFVDRYEGFYVLLTYVLLLISAMSYSNEKITNILLITIFISFTLIAILGLTQFYAIDFFQTSIGKILILPKSYEYMADDLKFAFLGQKIMYTTVYNPNYLGSYSALLLPISIGLCYLWSQKSKIKMVLSLLFVGASFVLFLGGMSRAGLFGGVIAITTLVILVRKPILQFSKLTVFILILFSGIYVIMDLTSGGLISREVNNTMPSSIEGPSNIKYMGNPIVKQILLKENILEFATNTESIKIIYQENKGLIITDESNKVLKLKENDEIFEFEDNKYNEYKISLFNNGFYLILNGAKIPFVNRDGRLYLYYKGKEFLTEFEKPETFGFKGYERFASNRGYIWSRSIPLLKDTLFLGYGPDTFAIYFPQREVNAKITYFKDPSIVVDKPHNWYLQMGINTGVISLLAMLAFLVWYWFKGFFLYIKDVNTSDKIIGASILCGVTGYCIAGIFNDSTVSVAPVFWVILGMGVALVNKYSLKKDKKAA